jgi:signal transduction histidine kinase
MHKPFLLSVLFFCNIFFANAQSADKKISLADARKIYNTAADPEKKLEAALIIINKYSGEGGALDDTAQRLIYAARELNRGKDNDTITYYLQIWQTEIFYYAGLYQFGIGSAEKQIEYGFKVKDSFLIASAYFFKAINLLELDSFHLVKINLDKALVFYPKYKPKIAYRKLAYHNQLVNVYAENFFEQKKYDSALYYNSSALQEAYSEKSLRGMPAGHLVQGKIFFELKKYDSANYHFNKTIELGWQNAHTDLVLAAYGKQILLQKNDKLITADFLKRGLALIDSEVINNSFKTFFYKDAIEVCNAQGNITTVQILQNKLLDIKDTDTKIGNKLVQSITTQIIDNENKLLKLQIEGFEKQKKLRNLQLLIAILLFGLILSVFLFVIRRNKAKYALLQQQSLIARELHDDVGASVSSIGMYAEIAGRRLAADAAALLPLNSISETVYEVSNNLKDIVWFIQPENEQFKKLTERIQQYAEPLCVQLDIALTFKYTSAEQLDKLTLVTKKSIFLCCKEAINNSIKYAKATALNVDFLAENNMLQITIADNGIGIDSNAKQGNGIINLKTRIKALQGDITWENRHGTKVIMQIPLSKTNMGKN